MSVISSMTVTPNRVEIIVRYLQTLGDRGIAYSDLLDQLSPPALRRARAGAEGTGNDETPSSVVTEALTETLNMHLIERVEIDGVKTARFVAPEHPAASSLLERLEHILLTPGVAEASGQGQFPRALAWFLAQDPVEPIDTNLNLGPRIAAQCGSDVNEFELKDVSRAQNLYYWARYLGYAWRIGQKDNTSQREKSVVVPDPSGALARYLSCLMSPGQTWSMEQLVASLADISSVLEGGAIRTEIEELLPSDLRRPQRTLSRSTSLALQRLARRGLIYLERQADAPAINLATWPDLLPISHVTYLRTA